MDISFLLFPNLLPQTQNFHFDLRLSANQLETLQAIDDVNHHRNLSKTYNSVKDLMEDLNA